MSPETLESSPDLEEVAPVSVGGPSPSPPKEKATVLSPEQTFRRRVRTPAHRVENTAPPSERRGSGGTTVVGVGTVRPRVGHRSMDPRHLMAMLLKKVLDRTSLDKLFDLRVSRPLRARAGVGCGAALLPRGQRGLRHGSSGTWTSPSRSPFSGTCPGRPRNRSYGG